MNITKTVQIEQIDAQTFFNKINALTALIDELKLRSVSSNDEAFLTRQEVADLLKVSLVTVWSWTEKGLLQSYRIGNKVRYKKSEIFKSPVAIKTVGKQQ